MDIITIRTYADPMSAELGKLYLEEEGIRCFLADQMAAAMPTVFGTNIGIRLQVMEKDRDIATTLLAELDAELAKSIAEAGDVEADDDDDPESVEAEPKQPLPLPSKDVDAHCPACKSPVVDKEYLTTFARLLLTIVLLGIPLLFLAPKRRCRKCGHAW